MKTDKIVKIVAAFLVVTIAAIGVKVVVSKVVDTPKKIIKTFETCLNERDFQGAVECLDPSTQSVVNVGNSLLEGTIGVNMFDALGTIDFFGQYMDDEDSEEYRNTRFEINVNHVEKDGDTAICDCTFNVYVNDKLESSEEGQLKCAKPDGDWYIDFSDEITGSLF